jgi:hypothetical protein
MTPFTATVTAAHKAVKKLLFSLNNLFPYSNDISIIQLITESSELLELQGPL